MRTYLWILAFFLAAAGLRAEVIPRPEYRVIAPGVSFGEVRFEKPLLTYYVLKVEANNPGLRLRPIRNQGEETLGEMGRRLLAAKEPLLGAISGDYFDDLPEYKVSVPYGILIQGGELVFSPTGKSALLLSAGRPPSISIPGLTARVAAEGRNSSLPVLAVNRPAAPGGQGCYLYTPAWGTFAPEIDRGTALTLQGGGWREGTDIPGKITGFNQMPVRALIPEDGFVLVFPDSAAAREAGMDFGKSVRIGISLDPPAVGAIGGGPRILRDGRVSIEFAQENFSPAHATYLGRARHPRSAVGVSAGGETVFLVVVEGRSEESQGMNINDLAELLRELGAADAISFDGGRSVGMFVGGRILGHGHRNIANALGVFTGEGEGL